MYTYEITDNKSWTSHEGMQALFPAKSLEITFGFSACISHQKFILSFLFPNFNNLLPTIQGAAQKLWGSPRYLNSTDPMVLIICNK